MECSQLKNEEGRPETTQRKEGFNSYERLPVNVFRYKSMLKRLQATVERFFFKEALSASAQAAAVQAL
ncbi:MAG: hypothetical protein RSB86_02115 [Comamonas sp.]|uniref:hypothetical protein n=1 Tax=Comamonas sp. TaxID=34028 RepID=UPI002FC99B32